MRVFRESLVAGQIDASLSIFRKGHAGNAVQQGGDRLIQRSNPLGFLQSAPVLLLIVRHAKNDPVPVSPADHCRSEVHGHGLSIHLQPVMIDEKPVFPDLAQHVFLRENAQMSLNILRGDRFRSVQHNIGKEILPICGQPEIRKTF